MKSKGRRVAIAALMLGVVTLTILGITSSHEIKNIVIEGWYEWRYGDQLQVAFYDVKGIVVPMPDFDWMGSDFDFSEGRMKEEREQRKLRFPGRLEIEALEELVMETEAEPKSVPPKFQGGKMMVKTTALNHWRIRQMLSSLEKGPSPADALQIIRRASR